LRRNDNPPLMAVRRCSHLENACEAAPVTASLPFRPLEVAVWRTSGFDFQ